GGLPGSGAEEGAFHADEVGEIEVLEVATVLLLAEDIAAKVKLDAAGGVLDVG
ncbi:MAG: hypothetical protein HW403_1489, partial [Dehalococcoidia bacterium]|nr:hypothetical protein [Dehalococcoidia bacterium]